METPLKFTALAQRSKAYQLLPAVLVLTGVLGLLGIGLYQSYERHQAETQLREAYKALLHRLGGGQPYLNQEQQRVEEHGEDASEGVKPEGVIREVVQIALTALVAAASLFVILSKRYGPKDKHWAYGAIGTLIGFWFTR